MEDGGEELFQELASDPVLKEAIEHYNLTCDTQDEADACPICAALHALEILQATSEEFKAPAFLKKVKQPPAVLAVMQELSIWFSQATVDFLDFINDNSVYDEDEDDEDEDDYEGDVRHG